MNSLAQSTIDAHGGLERWRWFEYASAHLRNGGLLWALKRQQGVIDDVTVRVALHREWASHAPFVAADVKTSFEPRRVALETVDGVVIEERLHPRDAFAGHRLDTPWDRLQLAYFAGYAMWTYLTTPFLFAWDDVLTEELPIWHERGERWRRLKVAFPPTVATHSAVQVFYVGDDGLLRRHDYDADVLGGSPVAHYLSGYREFSKLMVPTQRTVVPRRPDGTAEDGPVIVSIALDAVELS